MGILGIDFIFIGGISGFFNLELVIFSKWQYIKRKWKSSLQSNSAHGISSEKVKIILNYQVVVILSGNKNKTKFIDYACE